MISLFSEKRQVESEENNSKLWNITDLRELPTFWDATTVFPGKWRRRNERRNSMLMTRHYPDVGSASDWLKQTSHAARPIRSTTQIRVVTRHQYGISALTAFLGRHFAGKSVVASRNVSFFSQAKTLPTIFSGFPYKTNHVIRKRKYNYSWLHTVLAAGGSKKTGPTFAHYCELDNVKWSCWGIIFSYNTIHLIYVLLQSFWSLIVNFTHKDVLHELEHLSQIHTNVGKCRVSPMLFSFFFLSDHLKKAQCWQWSEPCSIPPPCTFVTDETSERLSFN